MRNASQPVFDESFRIAAVIPTKNRPDDLLCCVKSILAQQRQPDQLVVIDQSGDTVSKQQVEKLCHSEKHGFELLYIHDPTVSGLVQAKARGVQHSRADVIMFLEDDVVLAPDYVAVLECGFMDTPEMYGACGVVRAVPGQGDTYRWLFRFFHRGIFHDPRVGVHGAASARDGSLLQSNYLSGGLSAYRREVFERIPFDTVNGFFALEDIDFSTRAAREFGQDRFYINTGAVLDHAMSPLNRAVLFPRYERKVREFICFYKKNRDQHWALPSLLWLLVGLFLEALVESARTFRLSPLFGAASGLFLGISRRVWPL